MTELSLWLDNYGDIYSDFDSRNYSKRRISEDFLYELKTALHNGDKKETSLVLYLPANSRVTGDETTIAQSLNYYFVHELHRCSMLYTRKLQRGLLFLLTGMLIIAANILVTYYQKNSFLPTALKLLLEPAGWYFLWSALEFLFNDLKEAKEERAYYNNLSKMKILFRSYELDPYTHTPGKTVKEG